MADTEDDAISGAADNLRPLTPRDLAEKLKGRLGRCAIYEAIQRGDIPSVRVGQKIFIPPRWARDVFGI